jgi:hypothetical protein
VCAHTQRMLRKPIAEQGIADLALGRGASPLRLLQQIDTTTIREVRMNRLSRRAVLVIALGVFAYVTAPPVATAAIGTSAGNRCNEWVSCTGGCCDEEQVTETICGLLCPAWISAECTDDEIKCVDEPT